MRRLAIGLAMLTAVIVTPVWGDDKAPATDEKLYGTWTLTAAELKGMALPNPDAAELTIVISKDGKAVMKTKEKTTDATYKVDPAKTPKEIDIIPPASDASKPTLKCVYEVDGDTLKICIPISGPTKRPTAVDGKENMLWTLKRQKP